jgi:hypothetical protein
MLERRIGGVLNGRSANQTESFHLSRRGQGKAQGRHFAQAIWLETGQKKGGRAPRRIIGRL